MKPVFYLLIGSLLTPFGAVGQTLTLDDYLKAVREQSPDLQAEKATLEGVEARSHGIRINPPMVGVMTMIDAEGSKRGLEVSQELPFPTKIYRDKKVRASELQAQKENQRLQETSIVADARTAYFSYWSAHKRLEITKEKSDWLGHHLRMTRTATRSDNSAQIHLLQVESEVDVTATQVLAFESEVLEKRNALRIYAPRLPLDGLKPVDPPLSAHQISNASPLIAWKQAELVSKEQLLKAKKQAYLPDLFLRLRTYEQSGPQNQEIMVGVNLPFLYFWQPKAEIAEASAQRSKAQAELQKSMIEFDAKLKSFSVKAESIRAQLTLVNDKLIPRAQRQLKIISNQSQRTLDGLDEHKVVMIELLDLRSKSIELRFEYESLLGELSKLTGEKVGAL